MNLDIKNAGYEQYVTDLEQIFQTEVSAMEKSNNCSKWLYANEDGIKNLTESERTMLFKKINLHISRELKTLLDVMRPILHSLEPDLNACYREELTDEKLQMIQKKIYDAFQDLSVTYMHGQEDEDDNTRSIYALTSVVQGIASPLMRMQEIYRFGGAAPMSTFLHDIAGEEMHGVQGMSDRVRYREMLGDIDDNARKISAFVQWKEGLIRSSGIGMLKFIACTELLAWRLNPEMELNKTTFDLSSLIEMTGYSQSVRFNFKNKINLNCMVRVEEGTNTMITASKEMLYIIFMNILKNSGKIMAERKVPESDQAVEVNIFEQDDVLFIHYTDHIGGLDLTKLFQSAVKRVREIVRNRAGELLPHPLQVIAGGELSCGRSTDHEGSL